MMFPTKHTKVNSEETRFERDVDKLESFEEKNFYTRMDYMG